MRKLICSALALSFSIITSAQSVADFENLTLPPNTFFWDGQSNPLGFSFQSGAALFPNYFDTAFGGFWTQGWAYSTVNDSSTAGFTNLFATRAYTGFGGSGNYALGQQGSKIQLLGPAAGKIASGFYVSNTTYAYLSMRDGDAFAKKFGGSTGNDPDFFLLQISGWFQGQPTTDTVDFYLADFRFHDNNLDYIVGDWTWVDLTALGNVDSLQFDLSSSDNAGGWMNTPAFFAIDNFTTSNSGLSVANPAAPQLRVFPNPAADFVMVENTSTDFLNIQILSTDGRAIAQERIAPQTTFEWNTTGWAKGLYLMQIQSNTETITKKLIVR